VSCIRANHTKQKISLSLGAKKMKRLLISALTVVASVVGFSGIAGAQEAPVQRFQNEVINRNYNYGLPQNQPNIPTPNTVGLCGTNLYGGAMQTGFDSSPSLHLGFVHSINNPCAEPNANAMINARAVYGQTLRFQRPELTTEQIKQELDKLFPLPR
jgi:hypothetical protein